jgi:hypothetical protein
MAHALEARPAHRLRSLALGVLVGWFLLALGGSLLGVFDSAPRPPIMLGLGAVLPVVLFAVGYLASARFREFTASLDLRILTVAQSGRVVGLVFVILYFLGGLPGIFALPAGLGDFAIGITAPVIASQWKRPFPRSRFVVWNVLGILDLVNAVTLGVLAAQSPVGILAGDVSTRLMGQFPLSLIPTFFVPMFVIFHLISLIRVQQCGAEQVQAPDGPIQQRADDRLGR